MASLFAATSPERTEGLIFYGASAAYARKPDWPYFTSDEEFEAAWRVRRERSYEEYGWFTEGHRAPDLQSAKAILDRLKD